MKAFLSFSFVICSCFLASHAETNSSCEEQVNKRFCSSFGNVSKRVIEGQQYETYRIYIRGQGFTTQRREIFIDRSQVLMACNSSYTFSFNVSENSSAPDYFSDYYSDLNNTEDYECEYKIVDDFRICINETFFEVVSIANCFSYVMKERNSWILVMFLARKTHDPYYTVLPYFMITSSATAICYIVLQPCTCQQNIMNFVQLTLTEIHITSQYFVSIILDS